MASDQEELYTRLKKTTGYKRFRKKCRFRAGTSLALMLLFWTAILTTGYLSRPGPATKTCFGLLLLITLMLVFYAFRAAFARPSKVVCGTITDSRRQLHLIRNIRYPYYAVAREKYKVAGIDRNYWGRSAYEVIEGEGRGKKHRLGEEVLLFSLPFGSNFIVEEGVVSNGTTQVVRTTNVPY